MSLARRLAVLVVAFAAGCALADREATQDGPDPSIPGVDTGKTPQPAYGDDDDDDVPDSGAKSKKDGGSSTDSGHSSSDGSTTIATPDAGPSIPKPTAGEMLITEVMYNPFASEPDAEWFEVKNVASSARTEQRSGAAPRLWQQAGGGGGSRPPTAPHKPPCPT